MTLKPLHDRVVLVREDAPETTPSGLVLAPNAREKSNRAKVVAVGPGRVSDEGNIVRTSVQVGQTVLIGKWAGDIVQLDGTEHLIVREADILAVVEG